MADEQKEIELEDNPWRDDYEDDIDPEEDDELPRYTPEEYLAYLKAPQWVLDGASSPTEYESELCQKVRNWYDESKNAFRNEKEIWQICYERLQASGKAAIRAASIIEDAIAASMIPIMRNAMMQEISALYAGQYAPVFKPLGEGAQQMISMANKYWSVELKLNSWDTLKFRLGVDGYIADIWILKLDADYSNPGPFGKEARISMNRMDPLSCHPDPKAPDWKWELMDYFIVEESMDIGVAKRRFKDAAKKITKNLAQPDESQRERYPSSQLYSLTGQRKQWQAGVERQRIQIKECWLHDERMKFEAIEEPHPDDPSKMRVKTDDEGFVVGNWVPAYPDGRLVVTAADRTILQDMPNPYWHKSLPYVACPMSPTAGGKLFGIGKAASILGIERKVNDVETRTHSYMQSELERPMVADFGALPTNAQWFGLSNRSRAIVITQKGYNIVRPQPVDTPPFVDRYLARLERYRDQTTGVAAILRGEVPEGVNLSAQGIQGAQGLGMSVLNMESVFISNAMKEIGEKGLWLMRETYKEGMQGTCFTPAGEQIQVEWDEKAIGNEFFVEVDLAANQPGGQQAILQQAIDLKRERLVDRKYALSVSGIEGWENIDQRMSQERQEEIFTISAGKELGVNIKATERDDQGPKAKVK